MHGGQQPIGGSHVYVYSVGTGGYGTGSRSLLLPGVTTTADTDGNYYVTSDASGNFSVTGDYLCIAGTQVYLYASGGNPGAGNNAAIGLLAGLGQCPATGTLALAVPFVTLNEVSTIATAYALAGFATDATHVASGNTALAATGTANAMANIPNIVSLPYGTVLTTSPSGAANNPVQKINTLANILAACVNSSSALSNTCVTLLSKARSTGAPNGTAPTETATAAINIAHFPFSNIPTLYGLQDATAPFEPALSSAPSDFTVALDYVQTPAYLYDHPSRPNNQFLATSTIAIDANGDPWAVGGGTTSETDYTGFGNYAHLSPSGQVLASVTSLSPDPEGVVSIDSSGNAWAPTATAVVEVSSSGTVLSPAAGYTCAGMSQNASIVFGKNGLVYIGDEFPNQESNNDLIWELNHSDGSCAGNLNGGPYSPTAFLALDSQADVFEGAAGIDLIKFAGGAPTPQILSVANEGTMATDASDNVWILNFETTALYKYSSTGSPLSPENGYTGGGFAMPGGTPLSGTVPPMIDGAGTVWSALDIISSDGTGRRFYIFVAIANDGTALTPDSGMQLPFIADITAIAPDGSGNLWAANYFGDLIEFLGLTTPVATPVLYNQLGKRP